MTGKDKRIERAEASLLGLAVGDMFGESYFGDLDEVESLIASRILASNAWNYTDDSEMAMSVVSVLRQYGKIDQDALARSFADHYDMSRGYGPAMHRVLTSIAEGSDWRICPSQQFSGQGSWGNGAAMRVAPLGAYFTGDTAAVIREAVRSAEVTHTHLEGIAGAVAVALAAAEAAACGHRRPCPGRREFLDRVITNTPDSEVRSRICRARDMGDNASPAFAVAILGNGTGLSAQDTVPLALWCASQHLDNYEEALWLTVGCLGDRDTTCAIVGGIVALSSGVRSIPPDWIAAAEPLPDWAYDH